MTWRRGAGGADRGPPGGRLRAHLQREAQWADTNRAGRARLLKEAGPGDVLVVTRLDRLARSTRDLLNVLDRLGKADVGFKSLRETSVDTTSPQGRLVVNILFNGGG